MGETVPSKDMQVCTEISGYYNLAEVNVCGAERSIICSVTSQESQENWLSLAMNLLYALMFTGAAAC